MAFRDYDDFDYAYGPGLDAFASLLRNSRADTKTIELFGDSRHTMPSGAGGHMIAYLNALAFFRGRSLGKTQWCKASSYPAGGDSSGDWLVQGYIAGGSAPSLGANLPPNGAAYDVDVNYGAVWRLTPNAQAMRRTSCLEGGRWWDTSKTFYCDVLVGSKTTSGDLAWTFARSDVDQPANPSTDGTVVDRGTILATDMADARDQRWKVVTIGPFSLSTSKYGILRTYAARASATVRVGGCRFRMVEDTGGLVFQSRSIGGYKFTDIGASHYKMSPITALTGADCTLFAYGSNDMGASVTAAQAYTNMGQLIDDTRKIHSGNPDHLIGFCNSWPDANWSGANQTIYGQYTGAWADHCDADPKKRLFMLNTQKMLRDWGVWPTTQTLTGLTDAGAYTAATAYAADEYFTYPGPQGIPSLAYKVRTGFTSGASLDEPDTDLGWFWDTVPVHWFYYALADHGHASQFGSIIFASLFHQLLNNIERRAAA